MFWKKRNKDEHRYYLLPGMGRSNRKRRQQYFRSAIIVGFIVSIIFGSLLYYFGHFRP